MKRLRYAPAAAPGKHKPPSKKALQRAYQRTTALLDAVAAENADNAKRLALAQTVLSHTQRQLSETVTTLDQLTKPVWDEATISYEPPLNFNRAQIADTWSLRGTAHIAIQVHWQNLKMMARGDRETYRKTLAEQFSRKAYEHAIQALQLLSS